MTKKEDILVCAQIRKEDSLASVKEGMEEELRLSQPR